MAVSAISFWEVAMLDLRGRIVLPQLPPSWRRDWLEAGLLEHQLDGATAIQAAALDVFHPDPADQEILRWSGPLHRQDARG